VAPIAPAHAERVRLIEQIRELAASPLAVPTAASTTVEFSG